MEIQIPREVHSKIMHWINKATSDEISGFGKVTYHAETGVFQIHDAWLLKQTNGSAHTDIDGQSLAKLMYTSREEPGELKWWWHSHVKMPVFWSGTDTATIKELASQGWILATVFNQLDENRSALGIAANNATFGKEVVIKDELDFFIMDTTDENVVKAWNAEYDANVQAKTYTYNNSLYTPGRWNEESWRDRGNAATKMGDVDMDDYTFYSRNGWMGAGAWEEAKAIGLGFREYMDMLMSDKGVSEDVDQKLEHAVATGVLRLPELKTKRGKKK